MALRRAHFSPRARGGEGLAEHRCQAPLTPAAAHEVSSSIFTGVRVVPQTGNCLSWHFCSSER